MLLQIARMSREEQQQWMQHCIAQGAVTAPGLPDEAELAYAHFLTDGNPNELRKYGPILC